jgi:hypothetical protein
MKPTRAVVTLTEGRADIAVLIRCLAANGAGAALWGVHQPIAALPTPFGNPVGPQAQRSQILAWNRRRREQELNFHESVEDVDPVFQSALVIGDTLHVFVRLGGDKKAPEGLKLCEEVSSTFRVPGAGFDIRQVAFAFVFDADKASHYADGPERHCATPVESRQEWFRRRFASLLSSDSPTHGNWVGGAAHPVGLYVWHDSATLGGTLEDLVRPVVDTVVPAQLSAAETCVNQMAPQGGGGLARSADRLKATLTTVGQVGSPGQGLDGLLRGGAGASLPASAFQGGMGQSVADFYQRIPWP